MYLIIFLQSQQGMYISVMKYSIKLLCVYRKK